MDVEVRCCLQTKMMFKRLLPNAEAQEREQGHSFVLTLWRIWALLNYLPGIGARSAQVFVEDLQYCEAQGSFICWQSLSLKHAKKPLKTGKRKGRRFFKSSTQSGKRGRDNRKKQSPVDVQTKEFLVFIDVGNAHTIESVRKRLYI